MMEFEINMSEMPLGKLSKRNIQKGTFVQLSTSIGYLLCLFMWCLSSSADQILPDPDDVSGT